MTISNMASMQYAYRNILSNNNYLTQSLRNLSSGYGINSAADNAAGLGISESMRGQISGLSMASQNAQNGVSLIQTAEGGLSASADVLTRMRELAVQSANGTYSDADRAQLNKEMTSLKDELNRISASTNFNGTNVLDGSLGGRSGAQGVQSMGIDSIETTGSASGNATFSITRENGVTSITAQMDGRTLGTNRLDPDAESSTFNFGDSSITLNFGSPNNLQQGVISGVGVEAGSDRANLDGATGNALNSGMRFQVGANGAQAQQVSLLVGDMSARGLGVADIDIGTAEGARQALTAIDSAIGVNSDQRGTLGAMQNRLESTIRNLGVNQQNLAASESGIRDLDMAKEMMNYTQRQIMMNASQAVMAQSANLARQNMMSLLMR